MAKNPGILLATLMAMGGTAGLNRVRDARDAEFNNFVKSHQHPDRDAILIKRAEERRERKRQRNMAIAARNADR